ncbi:hypothetical protein, partial [Clostridium perfringens]
SYFGLSDLLRALNQTVRIRSDERFHLCPRQLFGPALLGALQINPLAKSFEIACRCLLELLSGFAIEEITRARDSLVHELKILRHLLRR